MIRTVIEPNSASMSAPVAARGGLVLPNGDPAITPTIDLPQAGGRPSTPVLENLKAETATAKKKSKKGNKVDHSFVVALCDAAEELGLVKTRWGKDITRQSMSVSLIPWAEFKAKLDPTSEADSAKATLFHRFKEALTVLNAQEQATIVLHRGGAAALYFRFA